MRKVIGFLTILIGLWACKESQLDPEPKPEVYSEFISVTDSTTRLYQWDSTAYSDFGDTTKIVHFTYEVKDVYKPFGKDFPGFYAVERYRADSNGVFTYRKNFLVEVNNAGYFETHNNLKIHKLYFPVQQGVEWDANAYNIEDELLFDVEEKNPAKAVVREIFDSNFVFNIQRYTHYTKGIGLTYYEDKFIETQNLKQAGYWVRMTFLGTEE